MIAGFARTALRYGAIALTVLLFLLNLRRAGEQAGRLSERLETMDRNDAIHRKMLEAASRRPAPVRDISVDSNIRYRVSGPRQITSSNFAQGGLDGTDILDGRITVIDQLTQELAQIDLTNIAELFVQSGADISTQEAIRIVTQEEVSRYHYVP